MKRGTLFLCLAVMLGIGAIGAIIIIQQKEPTFTYEIIYIEDMPCVYYVDYNKAGLTCDWSQYNRN